MILQQHFDGFGFLGKQLAWCYTRIIYGIVWSIVATFISCHMAPKVYLWHRLMVILIKLVAMSRLVAVVIWHCIDKCKLYLKVFSSVGEIVWSCTCAFHSFICQLQKLWTILDIDCTKCCIWCNSFTDPIVRNNIVFGIYHLDMHWWCNPNLIFFECQIHSIL